MTRRRAVVSTQREQLIAVPQQALDAIVRHLSVEVLVAIVSAGSWGNLVRRLNDLPRSCEREDPAADQATGSSTTTNPHTTAGTGMSSPNDTTDLAEEVTVDYNNQRLLIDGKEFPWWLTSEPVVQRGDVGADVTVTIMCRTVTEVGTPSQASAPCTPVMDPTASSEAFRSVLQGGHTDNLVAAHERLQGLDRRADLRHNGGHTFSTLRDLGDPGLRGSA